MGRDKQLFRTQNEFSNQQEFAIACEIDANNKDVEVNHEFLDIIQNNGDPAKIKEGQSNNLDFSNKR